MLGRQKNMRKVTLTDLQANPHEALTRGETLLIEQQGKPLGYFIPAPKREVRAAVAALEEAIENAKAEGNLSEEELVALFRLERD